MKASNLIKQLQKVIDENGDLDVVAIHVNQWQEAGWEDVRRVRCADLVSEDDDRRVIFIEAD